MSDGTKFEYELFFNLSPDLLCIAGFDGYFKKINNAVSVLLEYSMDELYAKPINDFVYDSDKEDTSRVRNDLIKSKPLFNFENRYVTKSGKIVWLSWTSYPVESEKLVFAVAKDITHKKRMEEERSQLLTDLTKVNKELKQLAFTTSHDLRSPVSSLLTGLGQIDITKINDGDTIELVELLKSSGKFINTTLNNYLDVLNEKHNTITNIEELSFEETLNHILNSIKPLIQNSKAEIHSDFSRLSKIRFNKSYLESMYLNFITNSIKYARPGILPVISIYTEIINGTKNMIVSDNGLGFDMEKVKEKIFGFHQTFHNNKDSKGIGLFLVYNQVTSLGGKIKVESKVNEGTKFIISFKK